MKALGHIFVSSRALDKSLLSAQGSLLPESVPYIPNNIFKWEEIHEGGEKLLEFCQKNKPDYIDLALGLMSHGINFGADKLNDRCWRGGEGYSHQKKHPLIDEVFMIHSGITYEQAKGLAHNYIEIGIDYNIMRNYPDIVAFSKKMIREINFKELGIILSDCFSKDVEKVKTMLRILFERFITEKNLSSIEGQSIMWRKMMAGIFPSSSLPNEDDIVVLIKKASMLISSDWEEFLEEVAEDVKNNLKNKF